ncbi:MAG TPA: hypothetical protein DIW31_09375 [Bacteroidales bacterium]|nr:hypothetical protein [Bacteroidales bacterium]
MDFSEEASDFLDLFCFLFWIKPKKELGFGVKPNLTVSKSELFKKQDAAKANSFNYCNIR